MRRFKLFMRWLMGLLFASTGVLHFVVPDRFAEIIPAYFPWHLALVYISGVAEIGLGVLLLVPRFTVLAAWGLIALLIAVFPANVNMALNPELQLGFPAAVLWARLPLQGLLIAWAYWFTRTREV